MYGDCDIKACEIVLRESQKLKNQTYWVKLQLEYNKSDRIASAMNSGERLVLIKLI